MHTNIMCPKASAGVKISMLFAEKMGGMRLWIPKWTSCKVDTVFLLGRALPH